MKAKRYFLILAAVWGISPCISYGQQNFTEGMISYAVRIEPAPGTDPKAEQVITGEFTITVKGNQYIRELQLSSGFRNRIIFNTDNNTAYSLRQVQNKKFAIQLNAAELLKKQQTCEQSRITAINCSEPGRVVAGYKVNCMQVACKDKMPMTLYYTKEWQLTSAYLFPDFPSFYNLPLAYDINNEDGSILHFELTKIEARPVDNGTFRVPADHRIISTEEYRQMGR